MSSRRRLEEPGGERFRPLAHRFGVVEDRRSSHRGAAAAEGADPARTLVGVAVEHGDVVQRDAELVGGDLRPGGLVSLPVWRRPAAHRDRAVGLHRDAAGLPGPETADLHVAGEADAERLAALGAPPGLLGAESGVVAGLERLVEGLLVLPAVVGEPGRGPVGELVRRNQVAAADLRGIDAQPAGQHVERPFDQVGGLRTAGAAVGLVRRGVRECAHRVGVGGGDVVRPHDHRPRERRRGRAGAAEVGARVVEDVHVAVPDPSVPVGRNIEGHEQVAAVGGGLEVLGAGREPAHRPPELQRQPGNQNFLGVEVRLGAEPAAHLRRDGPEALLGDPQDARHA